MNVQRYSEHQSPLLTSHPTQFLAANGDVVLIPIPEHVHSCKGTVPCIVWCLPFTRFTCVWSIIQEIRVSLNRKKTTLLPPLRKESQIGEFPVLFNDANQSFTAGRHHTNLRKLLLGDFDEEWKRIENVRDHQADKKWKKMNWFENTRQFGVDPPDCG